GPAPSVPPGGIPTALLCNLLGDDALPPHLLDAGIPPCAVTAMDDLNVVMIASTTHLALPPPERQPLLAGATRRSGRSVRCDTKSHVMSGFRRLEVRHGAEAVPWVLCPSLVPALTCVAGNGRVRSSGESPRVPAPTGCHR